MVTYLKISDLPVATEATGTDELEANQSGTTRRITVDQIADVVAAILPPPEAGWDDITGKPDFDALYVNVTGDTMTGNLIIDDPGSAAETVVYPAWIDLIGAPGISWQLQGAPADQKNWQMNTDPGAGNALALDAMSDAWGTLHRWSFARNGSTTLPGALTGTTATFTGHVSTNTLDVFEKNSTTGYSEVAYIRQANNAGLTNYTRLAVIQNSPDVMMLEVSDQANVKGSLWLQPFGGAVNLGAALTGTSATFTGTVFAPGAQIQMVSTQTGAVATGTTLIPADNTIPQQTEGDQYMTLAITPKSTTSKLVIDVVCHLSSAAGVVNVVSACLFQDATANALACSWQTSTSPSAALSVSFRHTMTSGTTSATTFKVRCGQQNAGTLTFNGSAGAGIYGGTLASSIVITESAT